MSNSYFSKITFDNSCSLSYLDLHQSIFNDVAFSGNFFMYSNLIDSDLSKSKMNNVSFLETKYSSKTKWPKTFDKTKLENLRKSKSLVCVDCEDQLNFLEVQLKKKS